MHRLWLDRCCNICAIAQWLFPDVSVSFAKYPNCVFSHMHQLQSHYCKRSCRRITLIITLRVAHHIHGTSLNKPIGKRKRCGGGTATGVVCVYSHLPRDFSTCNESRSLRAHLFIQAAVAVVDDDGDDDDDGRCDSDSAAARIGGDIECRKYLAAG